MVAFRHNKDYRTQVNASDLLQLFCARAVSANCLILHTPQGIEYRAVIEVSPINFSLLAEGEQDLIVEGFRSFLHRVTAYDILIHVRLERYDLAPYLKQLEKTALITELKEMVQDHRQFVESLAATRALLQRKFYLILPAEQETGKPKRDEAERFDRARSQLDQRANEIISDLERARLTARRLDSLEVARYYHACLHRRQAETYPLPTSVLEAVDRPVKPGRRKQKQRDASPRSIPNLVVPKTGSDAHQPPGSSDAISTSEHYPGWLSLAELLAPTAIEIQPGCVRIRANVGDEFIRAYAAIGYPAEVIPGWLDRFIQIDEPDLDLFLYIKPLESDPYVAGLGRKLTGLRATQLVEERHGRTPDPYVAAGRTEIETLRERLVKKEERVFGVSLYILVRAYSQRQLRERSDRVLSQLKSLEVAAVELTLEHHLAWQSCLPDARDLLQRKKIFDTSSLAMAFPFSSTSLSTPTGVLTGITPDGSLVIIDPTSPLLENGHEIKFARSGAGKSYDEKARLGRSLLMGYHVIAIDPEAEYDKLCQAYRGKKIRMAAGHYQLNPFDLPSTDQTERNVLREVILNLLVLFDLLLAEKGDRLKQPERGYLSRCLQKVYSDAGITQDPTTHSNRPPNMHDFYQFISTGKEQYEDVYGIKERLQFHVDSFPQETRLDLDQQLLIVFNIRDLDAESHTVGLFLITQFVWTQVRRFRHPVPCILSIDEAWTLLQHDDTGRVLSDIVRRARKYNLCVRMTTHHIEDFLNSEHGRTIFINAATKFLMKQDESTAATLAQAFHLSESERRFLATCSKGNGLFFARNSHVPLRVVASATEHEIAQTDQQELRQEQAAIAAAELAAQAALQQAEEPHSYNILLPSFYDAEKVESVNHADLTN